MTRRSATRSRVSTARTAAEESRSFETISDYGAFLSRAWRESRAPRESGAPTVVSLFAGCGGSSLGYQMAGFHERLAVEWDEHARECLRANFDGLSIAGDITTLTDAEALKLAGVSPGELDVLDGSPPCQGFSTMGKREFGDQRNQLFVEFARLLRAFRPRAFVMENVSGMVKGAHSLIFVDILAALKSCGYAVRVRLLNAKFFGVPQSRERLIFIGVRDDLVVEPSHPVGWSRPVSLAEAIVGVTEGGAVAVHSPLTYNENQQTMRAKGRLLFVREGFGPVVVSDVRNSQFDNRWRSVNRPCPTIARSRPPILMLSNGLSREMFASECARAGSFPDEFVFPGTKAQARNRIGNSVPPIFMRSIARHVRGLLP